MGTTESWTEWASFLTDPTNNAAECSLHRTVIWRNISGGTDSAVGGRFVERAMTVAATCRQQKRNVLVYLSSCLKANRHGQLSPSLLPATRECIELVLKSSVPSGERLRLENKAEAA